MIHFKFKSTAGECFTVYSKDLMSSALLACFCCLHCWDARCYPSTYTQVLACRSVECLLYVEVSVFCLKGTAIWQKCYFPKTCVLQIVCPWAFTGKTLPTLYNIRWEIFPKVFISRSFKVTVTQYVAHRTLSKKLCHAFALLLQCRSSMV